MSEKQGGDWAMVGECKQQARLSLRGKWGFGVGVTFLNQLILSFGSSILCLPFLVASVYFVNTLLEEVIIVLISLIYVVLSICFNGIVGMGYLKTFLSISRQEEATADFLFDYFSSFRSMLQAYKVAFLISLYTFLWSLLFIIPGMIKSFSYAMTYFILINHPEYTVHEAIEESQRMMKGYKRHLFLLFLSFIGWLLLIVVTFGIASFWVIPYYATALSHFYARVSQKTETEEV